MQKETVSEKRKQLEDSIESKVKEERELQQKLLAEEKHKDALALEEVMRMRTEKEKQILVCDKLLFFMCAWVYVIVRWLVIGGFVSEEKHEDALALKEVVRMRVEKANRFGMRYAMVFVCVCVFAYVCMCYVWGCCWLMEWEDL